MPSTDLVTAEFATQALTFPDRVDNLLDEIRSVEGRKELLDQAAAMQHYAKRLRAGMEIERPIAIGVLKIKRAIGSLCKSHQGKKLRSADERSFAKETIAAYRRMAQPEEDAFDAYCDECEANDEVPSQAGFLQRCTAISREAKEDKRQQRRDENAIKVEATADPLKVGAKFATIVIDPPWDWADEGDQDQLGRAKPTYQTMSFDQLLELPVGSMSDTDCHIYMWITNRSMPKGFPLLDAWGFRYVTILTWPKPSFGMGNYYRGQTEHVLFGVKGSQPLARKDASTLLPSWKRGRAHSGKPKEFLDFVETCSPGPYIELFARSRRKGWVAWGADA